MQRSPAGANTWTDICTALISPYSCAWSTPGVADGLYDLRALATDNVGRQTASATVTNRRVDNTVPATTLTDPGTPLRATVSLANTATDTGGSGIANVKVQRSPTGTGTWTDICSTATAAACSFNTTGVTDGVYDLRVLATDAAGNTATTVVAARTIDNTKPTGTDVQATNSGTSAQFTAGDTLALSFSEPIKPASILTGWTGASTAVTLRVTTANPAVLTIFNQANTTQLPLGSVSLGKRYATTAYVIPATMVMSGSTITFTLGAPSAGVLFLVTGTGTLSWTTVATPTDIAGNALTVGTVTETGAADLDF
jgi:hypothetical protein